MYCVDLLFVYLFSCSLDFLDCLASAVGIVFWFDEKAGYDKRRCDHLAPSGSFLLVHENPPVYYYRRDALDLSDEFNHVLSLRLWHAEADHSMGFWSLFLSA